MSKLTELQKKYPKAKYEPDPNCKKCNGVGETKRNTGAPVGPCICIFVDHDLAPMASEMLSALAKSLKKD